MTVELLNNPDITLPRPAEPIEELSLNWTDNPDIQELLDIIASIIAQEYIEIAKQHPETFIQINTDQKNID
ncbi:MAG: hypothetical protein KKD05_08545 [Candidatus Omnitrophica bacterium]|nr:hypothetical protein [Candidatus Omnitrophota bacterium]